VLLCQQFCVFSVFNGMFCYQRFVLPIIIDIILDNITSLPTAVLEMKMLMLLQRERGSLEGQEKMIY
jgi:hypothetical protein